MISNFISGDWHLPIKDAQDAHITMFTEKALSFKIKI